MMALAAKKKKQPVAGDKKEKVVAVKKKVVAGNKSSVARFNNLVVDGRSARFDVTGVDLCIVNSLRRSIMAEVPTAAFPFDAAGHPTDGGISLLRNSCCLNNEFVGHRVSLVPIGFDENQLHMFDPSNFRFVLKVKNDSCDMRVVTTADFEVFDRADAKLPKADRDALFPPCPETGDHIMLLRLRPSTLCDGNGEEIHMEAHAILGTGRKHARWSPVNNCFCRNKVDPELRRIALEGILRDMKQAGKSEEDMADARKQHDTLGAHQCFAKDDYGNPVAFEFFLESEAPRLRPTYLVFKGLSVLRHKLDEVKADLVSGGDSKTVVEPVPNMDDFYHITVRDEDHTLGNLIQGMLYRRWVRDGMSKEVAYIGYYQPHPLENNIAFKIKCMEPGDDVRLRFAEGVAWAAEQLDVLIQEWITFSGLDKEDVIEVNELLLRKQRKMTASAAVQST